MATEMFPGEFSALPLDISRTWDPPHLKSNPTLCIKSRLMSGARDMAMIASGIPFFDGGMKSPQSNLREMFGRKNENMLVATLERGCWL